MKFVKHFVRTQTVERAGMVKAKTSRYLKRAERKQQRACLRTALHRALVEARLEEIQCAAEGVAAAHQAVVERALRKASTSSKRQVRKQRAKRSNTSSGAARISFECPLSTRILHGSSSGQDMRVVARANCAGPTPDFG